MADELIGSLEAAFALYRQAVDDQRFNKAGVRGAILKLETAVGHLRGLAPEDLACISSRLSCLPNEPSNAWRKLDGLLKEVRSLPVTWPGSGVRINDPQLRLRDATYFLASEWKRITGNDPRAGGGPSSSLEFYKFAINVIRPHELADPEGLAFSTLILKHYRNDVRRWARHQT